MVSVTRLTPLEAIGGGLITERERKDLRRSAMPDMDLGGWQDIEDDAEYGVVGDRLRPPAVAAVIGFRCRVGLHSFRRHRCIRCRKLGRRYRAWPTS